MMHSQVFPEGLALLGDKMDELIERTARRTHMELREAEIKPNSPPSRISQKSPPRQRMQRMQFMRDQLVPVSRDDGGGSASGSGSPIGADSPSRRPAVLSPRSRGGHLENQVSSDEAVVGPVLNSLPPIVQVENHESYLVGGLTVLDSPLGPRSGGRTGAATLLYNDGARRSSKQPKVPARVGALTAAGFVWDKTQGACTPMVRQVLTFEEIAMLKRQATASGGVSEEAS